MRPLRNFKHNMCYHLYNRIAHRAHFFDVEERKRFVDRMRRVAEFSGIQVLAYCIMNNHFHIFVYAPEPVPLSDDELLERIRTLYIGDRLDDVQEEWEQIQGSPSSLEEFRQKYLRRMWNVSEFMKTLKQNTTMSINHRNNHDETLWGARFHSRAYDPRNKESLRSVAAYIDLNPVKAGLASWPDAYPWCGFSAACEGDKYCIDGYARIYSFVDPLNWDTIRAAHEQTMSYSVPEMPRELVDGKIRGEFLPLGLEDAAKSKIESLPHLIEHRSNRVAVKILELLRENYLSPSELRKALGFKNANGFTEHYLTPLEEAGYIEIADGQSRHSPVKKFRLTEKGRAVV